MKKLYNIALLLLLMAPVFVLANGGGDKGKYSKQKSIKKAYIVNSDADIDIQNSYGSIFVTTWDEDKIELDILIKVTGDNEEWVQKRIDGIDVDINALKNLVSAKTTIAAAGKNSGKNSSMEINYTIKIPKKGGVKLNNKYGNIITTDLFANVNVLCKYGKVTMAKLNGNANLVNIEYCNSSVIEMIKVGTVTANYSKLTLNDFGKLILNADYTDVTSLKGDDLKYDCNYGKLNFGKVGSISGKGDYLTIKADEISGDLKLDTDYSRISVGNITSKAKNITINSAYTNVTLGHDPGYAYNFDVSVKYANFGYEKDVEMDSKQEGSFSKSYQGYYRKSGDNKVTIRSEYGNVTLSKN